MIRAASPRCLIALFAACALAGCGGDHPDGGKQLDADRTERNIQRGVMSELTVKLDVECPKDRPLEKGDTFTCLASSADTDELEIQVRQTNDRGSIRWDARILTTDRYETTISQYIQQQRNIKVDVTCPDAVPIEAGGEFVCEARDPKTGETRDINVTQKDDEGNISYST